MRHGSLFLISLSRRPEAKQVQEAAAKVLMGSELKTVRCQWAGGVTAGVRVPPTRRGEGREGKRRRVRVTAKLLRVPGKQFFIEIP